MSINCPDYVSDASLPAAHGSPNQRGSTAPSRAGSRQRPLANVTAARAAPVTANVTASQRYRDFHRSARTVTDSERNPAASEGPRK